jgi:CBS domain containing-hemolysin-like protein
MIKLSLVALTVFIAGILLQQGTEEAAQHAATEALPRLSNLILPLTIIFLLVLINGLFVAAEFAIIGVRSTQLEPLAEEGSWPARSLFRILNSRPKLDGYIATAQLGITIASLGLAMYGEPAIGHFIEPYAVAAGISERVAQSLGYVAALSLMTYLHVVIGEMVPKAMALMDPLRMGMWLARPMQISQTILSIPVKILNGIGNLLLRLFRVPPAEGHARLLAAEELELLVAESAEGGLINVGEEEMIRNIFDFSERIVGQVMTPRPKLQAIPVDIPREALLQLVVESHHSRFPVYEGDLDHIVGILHLKDLVRQTVRTGGGFDLRLILRTAPVVPEDFGIEQLMVIFKRQKLHMAVVVDEFGGVAGVVTLEDLIEEVVGEVRDEFDQEREPYVEIAPGILELSGSYLLDDLADEVFLGEEDSLPDVETVGGLVITRLGRPPQIGDEVSYNQVRFVVLDVDRRAVTRVRIEFAVPDQSVPVDETAKNEEE